MRDRAGWNDPRPESAAGIGIKLWIAALAVAAAAQAAAQVPDFAAAPPPVAERRPVAVEHHGDRRTDDYLWLRERDDPATRRLLEAENAYGDAVLAPIRPLAAALEREMAARLQVADQTPRDRFGAYLYWRRAAADQQFHDVLRARALPDGRPGPEETIVATNALARGSRAFSLGGWEVTRDGRMLATLIDRDGSETYALSVREIATDRVAFELPAGTSEIRWAEDDATLFWTAEDETRRAFRLMRWRAGMPPAVVLEEPDARYALRLGASDGRRFAVVSASDDSSQVWLVDGRAPEAPPRLVVPRRHGRLAIVAPAGAEVFAILTDRGPDGRLVAFPADEPAEAGWRALREPDPAFPLTGLAAFARHLVLFGRRAGFPVAHVIDRSGGGGHDVVLPETAITLSMRWNPDYASETLALAWDSAATPETAVDWDMRARTARAVQRAHRADADPARYATTVEHARAADGTPVPVTIVRRREVARDGRGAALIDVYGAYGYANDAYWSSATISLLERGVVFAIAHVRGGGEFGHAWFEAGRLANKANTFRDTVAVAEHLVARGWAAPGRIALRGRSAGGLAVGAAINLRPELFRVALIGVGFVDVLTPMLDPGLPLTTVEYDDWGDPRLPGQYAWMRAYDPILNLARRPYPALLLTAGLNDPNVPYWIPARYVARMRAINPDARVVLHTGMDEGHAGATGRFAELGEDALTAAFALTLLEAPLTRP